MYLLSIDNGLTTTKAAIFSDDGKEQGTYLVKTVVENQGELAEIDMEEQWHNTAKAIQGCIKKSGITPEQIKGVGNSGHGAGLYLLDKDGRPVRQAISSMDGRTSSLIKRWTEKGLTDIYYKKTLQHMWNGLPVPLLAWLKDNELSNYNKIYKILMAKDWIKYKLTGKITTEYTDASCSGLMNLEKKGYDPEIFDYFNLEEMYDKLPVLTKSTDIAGYVSKRAAVETGLKEGTPVFGGLFDVVACALGNGVDNEQQYSITAGTWNINSAVGVKPVSSKDIMMWSFFIDPEKYIVIDSSATSAVNLEWFINNIIKGFGEINISDEDIFNKIETEISKIDPCTFNIIYLPFLYKSKLTKDLGSGFLGINASHNSYHLLRAIYEGVVFAHLKHLQNLKKSGINRKLASLSGGASKNQLWCQMFADILNIEVITTESSEIGALGTAICTAIGLNRYKNTEEAITSMVREKKRYYPGSINKAYMKRYNRFKDIIGLLDK